MLKKIFPVIEHINAPSALTTLGLLMGAATAYFIKHGELRWAILCLFICGILDLADGFVASRLNQITKFGQQMDSLVDFFTCCIMPIVIVYVYFYESRFVIGAMVFYAVCGLWRLSYFNILPQSTDPAEKRCFTGLPVPGAMMVVTMVFWAVLRFELPVWILGAAFLFLGFMMISFVKLRKYGLWQQIMWGVGVIFMVLVFVL
ncbi:MAG: CDP-alcohol phosphatidyltransferase family protein [Defluviitaleaceae bacterium]|nr:CDP-alcohol phosphatidyltransferase family protein [Defluviitaleaceae bacterium]MCL2275645.1 CDP-alcohol phosphatidyltransferase family protein [Defluviitaleaceae bacterium]